MASNYIHFNDPVASALIYQQVNANNSITTTSGTFSDMQFMSITVGEAGRYTIDGGSDISMNASGVSNKVELALYHNGNAIPNTTFTSGVNASGVSLASIGFSIPIFTHAVADLNAGDTVTIRFRRASGGATVTATSRFLKIIKVA